MENQTNQQQQQQQNSSQDTSSPTSSNGSNQETSPLRRSRQQFRRGSSQLSLKVVSGEPLSPSSSRDTDSLPSSSSSLTGNNIKQQAASSASKSPSSEKRRHTITVAVSPQITRRPSVTPSPVFSDPKSNVENSKSVNSTKALTIKSGVFAIQGRRKHMEDAHKIFNAASAPLEETEISSSIASSYPEIDPTALSYYGVFDGHGGKKASVFAAQRVHLYTLTSKLFPQNPTQAITEAFSRIETEFLQIAEKDTLSDGTTALTAFIVQNKMYVGCVGDSEGVLYRKGQPPVALNEPHNPSKNEKEAERVKAAGGRIVDGRVAHPMLNPNLFSIAVSRAIGDVVFKGKQFVGEDKGSGLIADVEVKEIELKPGEDEFFILACDGLWDVMNHEEAVEFVRAKLEEVKPRSVSSHKSSSQKMIEDSSEDESTTESEAGPVGGTGAEEEDEEDEDEEEDEEVEKVCKMLVEKAYKDGSMDNITAMICVLNWE